MSSLSCFSGIIFDSVKPMLSITSISLAIVILIILKKYKLSTKLKISLIYGHLSALFFPAVLLTTNVACGMLCMSCYNNILHLISYTIPSTLIISTLTGFFIIPTYYIFFNRKREINIKSIVNFVKKYSEKLNIKTPKLYAVDKVYPFAFSFRSLKSAIFLSVGLLDILNKKEIEAVILHELSHLRQTSSALKLTISFLKMFSPFSILIGFHNNLDEEERKADMFVINTQKTGKFLKSAKMKINTFDN